MKNQIALIRAVARSPRLFPRLARWLLGFLLLLAAVEAVTLLVMQRRFFQHAQQLVNSSLAASLAPQLRPFIHEASFDARALGELLAEFQRLGPMHGYYLVDAEGRIILASVELIRAARKEVRIAPIQRFVTASSDRTLPIFGDDPLHDSREVTFSAATLRGEPSPVYLYVTLQSSRMEDFYHALIDREGPVLVGITFSGAALFAAAASLLFSLFFVRRLQRLRTTVEEFRGGNIGARSSDAGQDELSFLSSSFNTMAETIAAQMLTIREQEESRRALVQNICHDLRTPLTSARGYVETLEIREDRLTAKERREFLGIVDKNLHFMQSMTQELFDLTSLDANERPLDHRAIDLGDLADQVVAKQGSDAMEAGCELTVVRGPGTLIVQGDPALLERVVTNLVQNAIRYTPRGGRVEVSVSAGAGAVRFAVRDTGIGIAKADQAKIFSRFYRTDKARITAPKGSGLGLAIVQRVMELHGTQIELQSEEGAGSEFAFSLRPVN